MRARSFGDKSQRTSSARSRSASGWRAPIISEVTSVQPGDHVVRGQRLGQVGETGSLRGPHLYFELRVDGEAVDPAGWLRRR